MDIKMSTFKDIALVLVLSQLASATALVYNDTLISHPAVVPRNCENGKGVSLVDKCYFINPNPNPFASDICGPGADLAEVSALSKQGAMILLRSMSQDPEANLKMWIGLILNLTLIQYFDYQYYSYRYEWVKSESPNVPSDYSEFSYFLGYKPCLGKETCMVIDTKEVSTEEGFVWKTEPCNNTNAALCERPSNKNGAPSCNPPLTGFSKYRNKCYLVVRSKRNYEDAQEVCSSFGAGAKLMSVKNPISRGIFMMNESPGWIGYKVETSGFHGAYSEDNQCSATPPGFRQNNCYNQNFNPSNIAAGCYVDHAGVYNNNNGACGSWKSTDCYCDAKPFMCVANNPAP